MTESADISTWLSKRLARIDAAHLRRPKRTVKALPDAWCEVDGQRLRNLAANDYLNLAHDRRLLEAARNALDDAGVGSTSSAMVAGRSEWQDRLEQRIARFEQREDAIVFPTGYAANMGVLTSLAGPDTAIFSDRLNHASLIDGCRLTKATRSIYDQNCLSELSDQLASAHSARMRIIVTDGVFSMDGNVAPLVALSDLATEHDAFIVVDEAHATGVFGANGRGSVEHCGIEDTVGLCTGTLSKALGCLGGFVSGSRDMIDHLWHSARTQFFSTALPPSICAAACAALEIVATEPERRTKLMKHSALLRQLLNEIGGVVVPHGAGPIIPVILNDPALATSVAARMREKGYFVGAIRPPTVPAGTSRLRISLSTAIDADEIHELASAVADSIGHTSLQMHSK